MSFAGDLEHLPIVDVIQLLHATKKSGTLHLRSQKGESQLVFQNGFIVSANHLNNSVRIGQVLVELGKLDRAVLESALRQQQEAGQPTPLLAILIENGHISQADAFKGLELLIELTIVDVLNWDRGTFTLDIDEVLISEEYNYFPETLKEAITLNTQNILMEALRIFDERRRDGVVEETSVDEDELTLAFGPGAPLPVVAAPKGELSAEDLGLDVLDALERKIPAVFSGIKDYDPVNIHRQFVRDELRDFSVEVQDKILALLVDASRGQPSGSTRPAAERALILYGHDDFIRHLLLTLCKKAGIFVFATDDESNLDLIIGQSIGKNLQPVLVFTTPLSNGIVVAQEVMVALRQAKMQQHPGLAVLQLVSPGDLLFSLQSLSAGVRAVFPQPTKDPGNKDFFAELNTFVDALLGYFNRGFGDGEASRLAAFSAALRELATLSEPAAISFALLSYVARHFARAVTLVVAKGELVAERSFGCSGGASAGATALKLRLPLGRNSLFDQVVDDGSRFYGPAVDPLMQSALYPPLGGPASGKALLLPLRSGGRVIAVIYADGEPGASGAAPLELLESMASFAGQQVEIAASRKRFEKSS